MQPDEVRAIMNYCMIKYAMEDERDIIDIWVDSVRHNSFISRLRSGNFLSHSATTRID